MKADFEEVTSIIAHNPSKGRAREEIVATFLERYLPARVRVAQSAQIITADGATSGECDVVMVDPDSPPLYDERSFRVLPIECVYGIVEVKSSLAPGEVADAAAGIRRVKELQRAAHKPQRGAILKSVNLYGRKWSEYFPTVGHIFAFTSGDLGEIARRLFEAERGVPYEQRVDAIYALDKGMVVRENHETLVIDPTPSSANHLLAVRSENPLLGMLLQLYDLYSAAWRPQLDLSKYFGETLGVPVAKLVPRKFITEQDNVIAVMPGDEADEPTGGSHPARG
jgi:hypothetical protein